WSQKWNVSNTSGFLLAFPFSTRPEAPASYWQALYGYHLKGDRIIYQDATVTECATKITQAAINAKVFAENEARCTEYLYNQYSSIPIISSGTYWFGAPGLQWNGMNLDNNRRYDDIVLKK